MPDLRKRPAIRAANPAVAAAESKASAVSFWMGVFIVISVGRASEVIPGGSAIPIGKVAFLFAAIVAWRNREFLTKVRLRDIPGAFSAFFVFALAILTVPFSIYRGGSLSHIDGIVVQMLAFWLIVRSAATLQDVIRILQSMIIAAGLLTMTTLLHYQGGRAASGSSLDTNDLAYVLVTIFPIALTFVLATRGWKKMMWAGVTVAMLVVVLLTQSRGGVIALLAMMLVGSALPLAPKTADRRVKVGSIVARIAIFALVGVVAWVALPAETKARLSTITSLGSDYNTDLTNNESRLTIWKRAGEAILDRPIGYGLGTFPMVDGTRGGQWRTAHNSLLQLSVELGVLALIFYLRAYAKTWSLLKKIDSLPPPAAADGIIDPRMLARALRWSLVGNFCAGFFLSQAYSNTLWTLIAASSALVVAMHIVLPPQPQQSRVRKRTAMANGAN